MEIQEKHPSKLLLVEGNDDQHVIWNLCKFHKIEKTFDVIDCKSIENVLQRFDLSINEESSRITTVGIVIDADEHLPARWSAVKRRLKECQNYSVPDTIPGKGLILKPEKPNKPIIGVWIMPNNKVNGRLEDFVTMLSGEEDKLLPVVDQTLLEIEEKGINRYKMIHKAKARIHTFLAWQEDPGTPMGLAITKKYLNPQSQNCQPFILWLNSLFNT